MLTNFESRKTFPSKVLVLSKQTKGCLSALWRQMLLMGGAAAELGCRRLLFEGKVLDGGWKVELLDTIPCCWSLHECCRMHPFVKASLGVARNLGRPLGPWRLEVGLWNEGFSVL